MAQTWLDSSNNYQIRNEAGLLQFFNCLEDAIKAFDLDNSIWKISYDGSEKNSRYRWIYKDPSDIWENEDRLNEISEVYKNKKKNDIFWINQRMPNKTDFPIEMLLNFKYEECEKNYYRRAIKNVVSDKEFRDSEFMKQFK